MSLNRSLCLRDVGELRLIEELVLPLARAHDAQTDAGDDCAYLPTVAGTLAVTADVGPKPLLQSIPGYENDHYAAGWMAVVATASDIATAGAKPFFLTNCIDAPSTLLVGELEDFLTGYFEASREFGFRNGGGDLRHGTSLTARVFGTGICREKRQPDRSSMKPGDNIVVVGAAGEFMATYLIAMSALQRSPPLELKREWIELLRRPRPKLAEMQMLVERGLIRAASDTSDGLIGAVDNLCRSSRVGATFELSSKLLAPTVNEAALKTGYSPWNIFSAWGDWSVVCAIDAIDFANFSEVCRQHSITWTDLGRAEHADAPIRATIDGSEIKDVTIIRNENFVSRGFNAGLAGHLDYILSTPIFSSPS